MIYPGVHDITVLQNSTWRGQFRATSGVKPVTLDVATATFTAPCHGLVADDLVVIAPATSNSVLPCGLAADTVYYVIATGLTMDAFKVSTTLGGASVTLQGTATGTFTVSKPVNITSYTVDSDIKGITDGAAIASFTCSIVDAVSGKFQLLLTPTDTAALEPGRYGYDVSLTTPDGDRYYWITGVVTLQKTYSRN